MIKIYSANNGMTSIMRLTKILTLSLLTVFSIFTAKLCVAEKIDTSSSLALMKKFDKLSLKSAESIYSPGLFLSAEINISRYGKNETVFEIKSFFNINILHPDNISLTVNDAYFRLDCAKNSSPILLYDTIELVYNYKKETINGIDYYTQLMFRVYNNKTKEILNNVYFRVEYNMSDANANNSGVPVIQKFICGNQSGNKEVYSRENKICPATGKIEPCVKLQSSNKVDYYFEIVEDQYVNCFYYSEEGEILNFLWLKRWKKFNSKHQIVEIQEGGETIKLAYYDNQLSDGNYYGKLKTIIYPDSSRSEYTYFPDGIIKSVETKKQE